MSTIPLRSKFVGSITAWFAAAVLVLLGGCPGRDPVGQGNAPPGSPSSSEMPSGRQSATSGGTAVTTDVNQVEIPAKPISGTLLGKPFQPTQFSLSNKVLELREGDDFFPDASIKIFLFGDSEVLPGSSWLIAPNDQGFGNKPHIHTSVKGEGESFGKTEIFTSEYALKLVFGAEVQGKVEGSLYIELPTSEKSVVSGVFQVELPVPIEDAPPSREQPSVYGTVTYPAAGMPEIAVGYFGVTAEGQSESNMVGTPKASSGSGGSSLTHKPRISSYRITEEGTAIFKHTRMTPGHYFVYGRFGEAFLEGEWLQVTAESAEKIEFGMQPETAGSLKIVGVTPEEQPHIRLLPLKAEGQLPLDIDEKQASSMGLAVKGQPEGNTVALDLLRPGAYRVFKLQQWRDVVIEAERETTAQFE